MEQSSSDDGKRVVLFEDPGWTRLLPLTYTRPVFLLLCGMETPPTRGWEYTIDFHRVFPRLAQRYGVELVPFLLAGVALNPDFNGDDSIHPNAAGAQRIAETVWPYLEPLVRAESAEAAAR